MVCRKFVVSFSFKTKVFIELKNNSANIKIDDGVIYTGNPKILKNVCPGIFGTIKLVGFCMIGRR